ncbi:MULTISPECIES: ATP-binding protein [unclassified Mesorhizobium]|uniref:AAA family ATPase n=1 Tax=unclassified Mesorhizobium TaxID=325217 RepID=UPI0003CE8402|nr:MULTISPECIES: ATP-binding protein [unclassified Mesorhizobium]ESY57399.1 abortive infection protein [Mesorhizobium sp. LNJC374B00]ESY60098.1 abortive infection protein [Mesorhizobium sp. LNJC372A00]WJI78656.1 AAA family ATPase [Mesorhizobium sp. C374B]WJI85190.1 AAA family ATPase [Mesorhizobium sp. C372A]
MLYRLEIENFQSIRDLQIIDLAAAGNAPDDPLRLAPLWKGATAVAPKVVGIFGPNASGKSNVLRALSFLAWFIRDSFQIQPDTALPFWRFNDAESVGKPTRLAIELGGVEDIDRVEDADASQCRYLYEVVIGGGAMKHIIEREVLSFQPSRSRRAVKLFHRDAEGKVTAGKDFKLAGFRPALEKILRPTVSVISTLARLEHPYSKAVWQVTEGVKSNILVERSDPSDDLVARNYLANPWHVERFNFEVQRADIGVRNIEVRQGETGPAMFFHHEGLVGPLPPAFESNGTRQFVKVFPLVLEALARGGLAVIDELDAALHPVLLAEIVSWFHDPTRNPRNAQLWMSCQNTTLLDELSKEEVLFCEKDRHGRTSVFRLRDVKGTRRTDAFSRKYLGGVYGALPQIG